MFTTFAAIAIFISCLGLFGLATYTAQVKTKEIGIRKVLGANIGSVVQLISKDFFKIGNYRNCNRNAVGLLGNG